MKRRSILLVLLLVLALPLAAQETSSVTSYGWVEADLALVYPVDWGAPLPQEAENRQILQMAQILVDAPDTRPPGIPFITLTLISPQAFDPDVPPDVGALLNDAVRQVGVNPSAALPTTLLNVPAVMTDGVSGDGLLYGVGRAARLPDFSVLIVTGRGLADQRDAFRQTFDATASSLVFGANSAPILPRYGVLWQNQRDVSDGADAFLDLGGLVYDMNGTLVALDRYLGLVRFDAVSGGLQEQIALDDPASVTAIALDTQGRIYIADFNCLCVQRQDGDAWTSVLELTSVEGSSSIVVTPDETLYATGIDSEGGIFVQSSAGEDISLNEWTTAQPWLVVDHGGALLALTIEGSVLRLENEAFVSFADLMTLPGGIVGATVDQNNHLAVLSQDRGLTVYDSAGNEMDSIAQTAETVSQPGQLVNPSGVAISPDGTVYVADSDGSFGVIIAMSTSVEAGRVGAPNLRLHLPVQGLLDEATSSQVWTFDGTAGQTVTISAVDVNRTDSFNVALHLLGANGQELAANDDQEDGTLYGFFDAQIADFRLPRDGRYTVIVARVSDVTGVYALGISQPRPFELNANGDTELSGELQDVFPVDRWTFQPRAGQTLTITMNAEGAALDTRLRLIDPNGNIVAENDDAEDAALGSDSQLVEVRIPYNGTYTLEAARFDGEGRYRVTISPLQ